MLGTTEQEQIHVLGTYLVTWTADSTWTVWREEKSKCFVARNEDGRTLLGHRTYEETYADWVNEFVHKKFDKRDSRTA